MADVRIKMDAGKLVYIGAVAEGLSNKTRLELLNKFRELRGKNYPA